MALMTVKAAPGVRVPKERSPREYITEAEAVEVSRSPYYLRRIADRDLVLVTLGQDDGHLPEAGDDTADAPVATDTGVGDVVAPPVKSRKSSQEKAS
ncbi:DUF2635 domain-containing protein [Trabulsiella odontotermitis]|uniref:DUF2635 domain-containing protein n=1 Tax=Trabulsiella odontotermitis TaxID=379893 RepID=UPI0006766195|nr:DUF2635 domain-containing protein [Trabulsiella odontotermitis]